MNRLASPSTALVMLLAASTSAMAQTSGSILPRDAKAGDRITVTTTSGAEFWGRLVSDSSGELVVSSDQREQTIAHGEIAEVTRYSNRFLFGPLIGVGAGLAVGLPIKRRFDNEGANGDRWLAITVGLGALLGTVIDLANGSDRTIYRRPSGARLDIQPRAKGGIVRWTVNW